MTKPLSPVSGLTPTPSHFNPPVANWGVRVVVTLLGVSLIGFLIYAIYRPSRSEPDSDSQTSDSSRLREGTSLGSTRAEAAPLPFVELDSQFSLDKPHSSQLTHNGKPCLNETQRLPFNRAAEGLIVISLGDLFNREKIAPTAMVTCWFQGEKFYKYQGKVDEQFILEFFMPNIPFQEAMSIQIDTGDQSRTVSLTADKASGLYRIDGNGSHFCTKFPQEREIRKYSLSSKKAIEKSSFFDITFNKEDQQVEVKPQNHPELITINNSQARTVIYLKIVSEGTYLSSGVSLALPFHFSPGRKREFLPSELIELWQLAYHQATGKEAPADLNLKLTEIQITAYKYGFF